MNPRHAPFTAAVLMEPLRVTLGGREPVSAARGRMIAHQAAAAPVIAAGDPIGVLSIQDVERAVRHGLGAVPCGALVAGAVRIVPPRAGAGTLYRASRGVCPALLVGGGQGTILGVIARDALDRRLEPLRRGPRAPAWLSGRDVGKTLAARLGRGRMTILRDAGRAGRRRGTAVYLVGGVVRDLLRGGDGKDFDLVVQGDGIALARELGARLGARVTAHAAFGTAVILPAGGGRIDVTSARGEVYDAPAALPRVAGGTILDDLLRRDVTINAIAIRLDGPAPGRLRDDLSGTRDLEAGALQVIHMMSFVEDPTRALRVARLASRLGFRLARDTRRALDLAADRGAFEMLSGTRMLRELSNVFGEPDPAAALAALARMDLLRRIGPGLEWDGTRRRALGRLVKATRSGHPPFGAADPTRAALMILSAGAPSRARALLADRLAIRGRARTSLLAFSRVSSSLGRLAARRPASPSRIARACERADATVLLAAWASGSGRLRAAIDRYLAQDRATRAALTGDDLQRIGIPRGPHIGRILAALRWARIDGSAVDEAAQRRLAKRLGRRIPGGPKNARGR